MQANSPAVEEQPAMVDEPPAAADETSAPVDDASPAVDDASSPIDDASAAATEAAEAPVDELPAAGDEAPAPIDDGPLPDHLEFNDAFFTRCKNAYFRLSEGDEEAVMVMPVNGTEYALKLDGIRNELKLDPGDRDSRMLAAVAEGLQYVQALRVGDKMPNELTTGRASWKVAERHHAIARDRLFAQLVTWLSGEEQIITEPEELHRMMEDPDVKAKVNAAFDNAIKQLGLEADQREEVVKLVDDLSIEIAYIEALRDKFRDVVGVVQKLAMLRKAYAGERAVSATILSALRLAKLAVQRYHDTFELVDAQTGEIISVLKNFQSQIEFLRTTRNELYCRLKAWDEHVEKWRYVEGKKRMAGGDKLIESLYQFLAQRYLPVDEWVLMSKLQMHQQADTERVW